MSEWMIVTAVILSIATVGAFLVVHLLRLFKEFTGEEEDDG